MASTIDAPQQWVENIAMLRLPEQADRRLQQLMDRNNEGQLTEQEILAAVQELSPAYRAVFNLYVVEGYSHKEIGEALQITESTSRSNLVKARIKLQEFFASRRMDFEIGKVEAQLD